MRLPTRMGGLGLTETADIAPAAFVGSLAAWVRGRFHVKEYPFVYRLYLGCILLYPRIRV